MVLSYMYDWSDYMSKVKCRFCGKSIDKKIAVGVPHNRQTWYYCTDHVGKKPPKELFYEELVKILPSTNTIIYKEMDEISKVHGYEKMLAYLQDNEDYLIDTMNRKSFAKDYYRCKYFCAILKNNLGDYQMKQSIPVIKKEVEFDMDVGVNNYKRRETRKGMDDILANLLEDE